MNAGNISSHASMRLVSIGWSSPRFTIRVVSSTQTFTTSAWNPLWSFVTVSSPLEKAAVRTLRSGLAASNGSSRSGSNASS